MNGPDRVAIAGWKLHCAAHVGYRRWVRRVSTLLTVSGWAGMDALVVGQPAVGWGSGLFVLGVMFAGLVLSMNAPGAWLRCRWVRRWCIGWVWWWRGRRRRVLARAAASACIVFAGLERAARSRLLPGSVFVADAVRALRLGEYLVAALWVGLVGVLAVVVRWVGAPRVGEEWT